MKPVKQRYHTDTGSLEYGDCFRACVASVLELPLDDTPHFRQGMSDDPRGGAMMKAALVDWLRPRGIGLLQFNVKAATLTETLTWCRNYNPESYLILGGKGPGGQGHAVVVHQGEVVHDPGITADDDGKPPLVGPLPNGDFVVLAFEHRPEQKAPAPDEPVEIPPPPDCSILDKHERIGFSFSGGKDSLAVLHLLRPHWGRMTIYHCSTGDLLPETVEIVDQAEELVAKEGGLFCHITTNSIAFQEKFGLVSDIVPHDCTPTGRALLHGKAGRIPLVDRATCCHQNLALPVQSRMQEDGVTLTIRGTRRSDPAWGWLDSPRAATGPTTFVDGPLTIWTPIHDWTTPQVFAYLRSVGAPIARYYEGPFKHSGPECSRCTAWLDEGRAAYLKKYHPVRAGEYFVRLSRVRSAIRPTLQQLEDELAELSTPIT